MASLSVKVKTECLGMFLTILNFTDLFTFEPNSAW
jgi:hypothetical protein